MLGFVTDTSQQHVACAQVDIMTCDIKAAMEVGARCVQCASHAVCRRLMVALFLHACLLSQWRGHWGAAKGWHR